MRMPVVALGPTARALARRPMATALLVLEVALGLALSIESLLYVRALRHTETLPVGMPVSRLLLLTSEGLAPGVPSAADNTRSAARDLQTLRADPSVEAAAFARIAPFDPTSLAQQVATLGSDPRATAAWTLAGDAELGPALGVQPYAGRLLAAEDAPAAPGPVPVVISRAVANRIFYPPRAAVGQLVALPDGLARVVGVAQHFVPQGPFKVRASSMLLRLEAPSANRALGYVVRARSEVTEADVARLARSLERVSPGRVVLGEPLAVALHRLNGNVHGAYRVFRAMVAIIVSVVLLGVFAMSWLFVAEQTRQLGIRRALGATRADVVAHVLTTHVLATWLGVSAGVGIAYALNTLAERVEDDMIFSWPLALSVMAAFVIVGQLAALAPALRAANVPPRQAFAA